MGAVSAGTGRDKIKEKRILRTKKHHLSDGAVFSLERAMGVEPTSKAWEVAVQILEDDMPARRISLKPLLYKRFKDFSFLKIDAAESLVFGF